MNNYDNSIYITQCNYKTKHKLTDLTPRQLVDLACSTIEDLNSKWPATD